MSRENSLTGEASLPRENSLSGEGSLSVGDQLWVTSRDCRQGQSQPDGHTRPMHALVHALIRVLIHVLIHALMQALMQALMHALIPAMTFR